MLTKKVPDTDYIRSVELSMTEMKNSIRKVILKLEMVLLIAFTPSLVLFFITKYEYFNIFNYSNK